MVKAGTLTSPSTKKSLDLLTEKFLVNKWGPESHGAKLLINDPTGIEKYAHFYFDIETDEKDNITCLALCPTDKVVYWFSWPNNPHEEIVKKVLLSSHLSGQNVKGDIRWLVSNGIPVTIDQVISDTQLEAYVQESTRQSLSLKDLSKDILEWYYPSYKDIVKGKYYRNLAVKLDESLYRLGKRGNKLLPLKVTMDRQPDFVRANYNAMDALSGKTLQNINRMVMTNSQKRFFKQVELPVLKVIYRMEEKGIKIDVNKLQLLHNEWTTHLNKANEDIKSIVGEDYNPNSPKQTLKVLRDQGIHIGSTGKEILETMKENKLVSALLTYRKFKKLVGTYSDPLLKKTLTDPEQRIHASFNQVAFKKGDQKEKGIRTGRLSCSDPNLQNIHARDEDVEGKEENHPLRYVFVAAKDHILFGADYSQIEYRLLAHESGEPTLLEAYYKGYDVHKATAAKIFNLQIANVTKEQRAKAKNINFAIVYGAGPAKIAMMAKCSYQEAEDAINTYYKELPYVIKWKHELLDKAREIGGVETLFGRFIPIPDIRQHNDYLRWGAERQVIDYRIQGSASDIMKMAMIRMSRFHNEIPVLSVHDELVYEKHKRTDRNWGKLLSYEMENVVKLKVPLIAKSLIGPSWGDLK